MKTPYLEIDLSKVQDNAEQLVAMAGAKGIDITGVTKSVLGNPRIAACLVAAGISSLGDSRLDNIVRMKTADIKAPFVLIRTPTVGEAHDVVENVDVSFNSELVVIAELSREAIRQHTTHDIVLMVEMGDLREGVPVRDLAKTIEAIQFMDGIRLKGLGMNLACMNGVKPSQANMALFSDLAEKYEKQHGLLFHIISGGNSANIQWMEKVDSPGRINTVRLGESIFIGRETISQQHIKGLHLNAITLVAEVIESKIKPSCPMGDIGLDAFGKNPVFEDKGEMLRSIVALGKQDVTVAGLTPLMDVDIIGSSSDHIVLDSTRAPLQVGDRVSFGLDYAALLSSMTSPFVANNYIQPSTDTWCILNNSFAEGLSTWG